MFNTLIVAILHTAFSYTFFYWKLLYLYLNFTEGCSQWSNELQTRYQIMAPYSPQAIILMNDDLVYRLMYTQLWVKEVMYIIKHRLSLWPSILPALTTKLVSWWGSVFNYITMQPCYNMINFHPQILTVDTPQLTSTIIIFIEYKIDITLSHHLYKCSQYTSTCNSNILSAYYYNVYKQKLTS